MHTYYVIKARFCFNCKIHLTINVFFININKKIQIIRKIHQNKKVK